MPKFNLVGNTFNYEDAPRCSVWGKESKHIDGPLGVRGRNSDNTLIREKLGWDYSITLEEGIKKTYEWIRWQINKKIYS